ncbi:MAG: serine/threonine-protein kinase [Rikenellaceae bacterium]
MAIVKLNKEAICYEFDPTNPSDHLGTGGMGVVFKGRRIDTESGRIDSVAIKVLFKDLPVESIARARREASIQVEHENVIRMYGCVDVVDSEQRLTCHVISEYLDGDTLDKRSDNGEVFTETEAIKIVKSILSGLYMIHDKGYIHRDIDPSNVMICKNGKIKLIDFGIAKSTTGGDVAEGEESLKKGTQVGKFIGKIFYASPEQAQGLHTETDKRSDVYSAGVLFYQLLTGHVPFDGNTIYEIIRQHIESPIVFDNNVAANLQNIIKKATAKRKEDRYQSVSEFIVDLEKHENGLYIPPPKINKDKRSTKSSNKAWIFITITLLLILVTGGGFAYLYLSQSNETQRVEKLVKYGQYDKALDQYREATKLYSSQSTKDKIKLLSDAKEIIMRYNHIAPNDSLLMGDLVSIGDRGFEDGYYYAAELCFDGILTTSDQSLAIDYLQKGMQRGGLLSTYRLGEAYHNGEHVKSNKRLADTYFKEVTKAIEQYNIDELSPELQYIYGKMYRYGYSVEQNDTKAKELFTKATESNLASGYYELYLMHKDSKGRDALNYLNRAVELGYTKAEYTLAMLKIAEYHYTEAIELLKSVSTKGYTLADKQLAYAYYRVAQSKKRSKSEYVKFMKLAIETNNGDAKWRDELYLYLNPPIVIAEPEIKPEPKPEAEAEAKTETETETKTEVKPEPETKIETETTEANREPETINHGITWE